MEFGSWARWQERVWDWAPSDKRKKSVVTATVGPLMMCGNIGEGWQKSPGTSQRLTKHQLPSQKEKRNAGKALSASIGCLLLRHLWAGRKEMWRTFDHQLLNKYTDKKHSQREGGQDYLAHSFRQNFMFLFCLRVSQQHLNVNQCVLSSRIPGISGLLPNINGHYHKQCFLHSDCSRIERSPNQPHSERGNTGAYIMELEIQWEIPSICKLQDIVHEVRKFIFMWMFLPSKTFPWGMGIKVSDRVLA